MYIYTYIYLYIHIYTHAHMYIFICVLCMTCARVCHDLFQSRNLVHAPSKLRNFKKVK